MPPTDEPCASRLVPCAAAANEALLTSTSVHSTRRVIVGAVVELAEFDADVGYWRFNVDLQVNNNRELSVFLVGQRWQLVDAKGQMQNTESHGFGKGGMTQA